jgi:hypothetical protein
MAGPHALLAQMRWSRSGDPLVTGPVQRDQPLAGRSRPAPHVSMTGILREPPSRASPFFSQPYPARTRNPKQNARHLYRILCEHIGHKVTLTDCNPVKVENQRPPKAAGYLACAESAGRKWPIRSCTGRPSVKWTLWGGPVASQTPGQCLDDSGISSTNANAPTCDLATAGPLRPRRQNPTTRCGCTASASTFTMRGGSARPWWICTAATAGAQQWHIVPDGAETRLVNPGDRSMPGRSRGCGDRRGAPCRSLAGRTAHRHGNGK